MTLDTITPEKILDDNTAPYSGHTPGPWRVEKLGTYRGNHRIGEYPIVADVGRPVVVACAWVHLTKAAQAGRANAALVAAAPRLLAACRLAQVWVQSELAACQDWGTDLPDELVALARALDEALANDGR